MNYNDKRGMCRVDFFRPSGKWYGTESVDFGEFYEDFMGFEKALDKHLRRQDSYRLSGMIAVCLEPYLKHEFPRMIAVDDICECLNEYKK